VLAAQLGAGLYVLGGIVEAGGRLRVSASLYDQEGTLRSTAHAEGTQESDIFALVDHLSGQLLAAAGGGAANRMSSLAALTSESFPALKAYLEGERHARHLRHREAAEAFGGALALDSTFALAAYALSNASTWIGDVGAAREAVQRAARFRGRLPESERLLVEALLAYNRRAPETAEALYREVLVRRPGDVEARYRLGEVEFYLNPLRGRSFLESRPTFQQVLALQPDHELARLNLVYGAAWSADPVALDTLLPPLLAAAPQDSLRLLLLRAYATGDGSAADTLVARAVAAGDEDVYKMASDVARFAGHTRGAQRIGTSLTDAGRMTSFRSTGHLLLAYMELANGRFAASRREIDALAGLNPAAALQARAWFATLPFAPASAEELRAARDALLDWRGNAPPVPYFGLFTGMRPQIRAYQVGLLSARIGDTAAVQRQLAELQRLDADTVYPQLAATLAEALRASAAAAGGDTASALALLDRTRFEGAPSLSLPSSDAHGHQRHLRPYLLRSLGRDTEALAWLGAGPWHAPRGEHTLLDLVYRAPFHFQQGEILERMGRGREASEHYDRFAALWRDADAELQPMVAEAERRASRLRRGR
jgi:tetratricopeptide (TPR) repeat protein